MRKDLSAVLCLALGACSGSLPEPPEADSKVRTVSFLTLAQGATSQPICPSPTDTVIRSAADWQAFWIELHPEEPRPPIPPVSFEVSWVLATCGPRPDASHFSTLMGGTYTEGDSAVVVTVRDTRPAVQCTATPAPHYGYHVVMSYYRALDAFDHWDDFSIECEEGPLDFAWQTVEWEPWGYDNGCEGDRLIRTPDEWEALWLQLHRGTSEPSTRPVVDFERSSLVLTCRGLKPRLFYDTEIVAVATDGPDGVIVSVLDNDAGDCGGPDAASEPFHIVMVNRVLTRASFTHASRDNCDAG